MAITISGDSPNLTSPNITGAVVSAMASSVITSGTFVSASGTSVDFTSIPSWVKRITVMLDGVSLTGTTHALLQLGDSGGIETTGYNSSVASIASTPTIVSSTAGFIWYQSTADYTNWVTITLVNISGNTWLSSLNGKASYSSGSINTTQNGGGSKTLSATLDRVRLTSVNGTDTFDAGSINILYE